LSTLLSSAPTFRKSPPTDDDSAQSTAANSSSRTLLRQARVSFDLALSSTFVSVVGTVQLLGYVPEGSLTASTRVVSSVLCLRFAKDANDRLDKLATELKDE
jgi:hypothetical protein